ncbi:NAD-dependent deacetylase [Aquimarina sp. W85]|uniref:SIR2 family NAD-dependent protein deacylase n=1 Tax=Aquimarina rhodophyticola TaxID=3342246 RepID=UPI00367307E7
MKNIVVLSGAGMSAESGINTFRDSNGLWEGHDIMEVASPIGWKNNPQHVLDFYNQRRKQLLLVEPNAAHRALVSLEDKFNVSILTQNVDDLHERAGSSNVLHLHGELLKVRSQFDENLILDWKNDLIIGDLCEHQSQLRPHIVWFGEDVPLFDQAISIIKKADLIFIIGTSMQVYPAASLLNYATTQEIFYIDPNPQINAVKNIKIIQEKATTGVVTLVTSLLNQ